MIAHPLRYLVVLDVDSTLINEEGIDLLAESAGEEVARAIRTITEEAMQGGWDFTESLTRRVGLLAGLPLSAVDQAAKRLTPTRGATELISAVHASGGVVAAVSGGFHDMIDGLAESLGLDHWRANRFEVKDGVLTGRVHGAVVDAEEKRKALLEWAAEHGIPAEQTVAVGDGANDVLMLSQAHTSVAFCAKPVLREVATHSVTERDLAQVIDLLGLPRP